jgi:DNA-binding CsgD family transcriptional regulator
LEEKHPDLSVNDLRQCAYIKMNLRSNEVAFINNINKKSVYMIRYRLKHKLGLNPSDDIKAYLDHFE